VRRNSGLVRALCFGKDKNIGGGQGGKEKTKFQKRVFAISIIALFAPDLKDFFIG